MPLTMMPTTRPTRTRPPRHRSGEQQRGTVQRAFYVYILVGSCLFVVVHQFRQTARVAKVIGRPEKAAFLPEWSLDALLNAWWHQDYLLDEEYNDDDLDDDNVFEDDDKDPVLEESSEEDSQDRLEDIDKLLRKLRKEMDDYAKSHQGRLDPTITRTYQKALKRKRAYFRRKREERNTYNDKRGANDALPFDSRINMTRVQVNSANKKAQRKERMDRVMDRRKQQRVRSEAHALWRPPGYNTTDYSKYPILPMDNRKLPDMNETGGVIFFLHVPKTGGQTVRQFNTKFWRHAQRRGKRKSLEARLLAKQNAGADELFVKKQPEPTPEALELMNLCRERMRYIPANTLEVFQQNAVPLVNHYLLNHSSVTTRNNILFVEVHGMDNHHMFELEPFLHYWREQSQKMGVPFFAFTLLREALSLQVSFFNYYYIHPGDWRFCINPIKPKQRCGERRDRDKMRLERLRMREERRRGKMAMEEELTENGFPDTRIERIHPNYRRKKETHENGMQGMAHEELESAMLQVAYDNPQCLFLARGERTFGDEPEQSEKAKERSGLQRNECQNMYLSLQRTMDWIGRTDTLDKETLPLLTNIMFRKPALAKSLPKANVSPHDGGWVRLAESSATTKKKLLKKSQLDQELYHQIKEDYTMDQWDRSSEIKPSGQGRKPIKF